MQDERIFIDEGGHRRLKNKEFVLPVCIGTVAWWLGKKASEHNTHRWTVYLRGPNNEDLSHIISKVVFQLHSTFNNPNRNIEVQPYEVTENGWGEFDVGIVVHFTLDSYEKEVQLYKRLKLYEEDGSQLTTKKPVVCEMYEELVFSEPVEDFYNRVVNVRPGPAALMTHQGFVVPAEEAMELANIRMCRDKVAGMVAELRREYEAQTN